MQLDLQQATIYLVTDSPDFRKQIDGLVTIIVESFSAKINEGIFVFINRRRNKAKIIFWHKNGFAMLYKRLEKNKFTLIKDPSGIFTMSEQRFEWLLNGYDWVNMSEMNTPNFDMLYQ